MRRINSDDIPKGAVVAIDLRTTTAVTGVTARSYREEVSGFKYLVTSVPAAADDYDDVVAAFPDEATAVRFAKGVATLRVVRLP